jgi:hypothetical protein
MVGFDRGKRRVFVLLAGVAFVVLILNLSMLSGTDVRSTIKNIPIPGKPQETSPDPNVGTPESTMDNYTKL